MNQAEYKERMQAKRKKNQAAWEARAQRERMAAEKPVDTTAGESALTSSSSASTEATSEITLVDKPPVAHITEPQGSITDARDNVGAACEGTHGRDARATDTGRRDDGGSSDPNPQSEIRNPKSRTIRDPKLTARLRDPVLLARLGITNENLERAAEFMYSGGVQRFWATREALKLPLIDPEAQRELEGELSESEKILREMEDSGEVTSQTGRRDAGGPRKNGRGRPSIRRKVDEAYVPAWQSLTGLFPNTERMMSPDARDAALKELMNIVVALLRNEMKMAAETPDIYHSSSWDPLRKICFHIGIAYSKFSAYSKELTGLAGYEIVDRLRAEDLKDKMRADVRVFAASLPADFFQEEIKGKRIPPRKDQQWKQSYKLWQELKSSRIAPEWHRGEWAQQLGYSNYARFYRACLMFYGKTPTQLEFELVKEWVSAMQSGTTRGEGAPSTALAGETPAVPGKTQQVQFFTDSEQLNELMRKRGDQGEKMAESA